MDFNLVKWYFKKSIDTLNLRLVLICMFVFWILFSNLIIRKKYQEIQYLINENNIEKINKLRKNSNFDVTLFHFDLMNYLGRSIFTIQSINFNKNKILISFIGDKDKLSIFTKDLIIFINKYTVNLMGVTIHNLNKKQVTVQVELTYE
ncbi:hypothetical protein [Acinetobacter bereziniae]|uniref:hypothetical protein n=1 Tax=Acinetobacter bereziniae TaxID=106648 RepID=UPI001901B544|nr:hypothetical protein [Acinetobacter bereziniae]MBJ8553295.1 hypothetical protein [Acinetobacter bereziniae]